MNKIMTFEYLLLILLSLLPLAYKVSFWMEIFSLWETLWYTLKKWFSHFWSYIEFPLFFFSLTIFIEPLFEIFLYSFFFYFLVLYNIFVWGKIFRKKIPHVRKRFVVCISTFWAWAGLVAIVYFSPLYLYLGVIGIFFMIPFMASLKYLYTFYWK